MSCNGMISGFSHGGYCNEAVILFQNMHIERFLRNEITVSSVLPAAEILNK